MRKMFFNLGYFLKEAKNIIKLNLLSNIFSLLGTVLILFMLGLVVAGWGAGNRLIHMLEQESEISAFFEENTSEAEALGLSENIAEINGVRSARIIGESEAYDRMRNVLGEEAKILTLFEGNPFEAYLEIRIEPGRIDAILQKVEGIEGIDYVRDNREILDRIDGVIEALNVLGYLVIIAVGVTTVLIISHMIRQGIYNNREQINTLRILGASYPFIGFPFILVGLLLTLGGGLLASLITVLLIRLGYNFMSGAIPFIPLPPRDELTLHVTVILLGVSIILGIAGSLFGLSSIKSNRND